MILKTPYNNPVAAPGTDSKAGLLAAYRLWTGNEYASYNDLYAFMTVPSPSRDRFLNTLTPVVDIHHSKFYTQRYDG